MANPTVRASATANSGTGSPTCTKPTGTVDGDVLVAGVMSTGSDAANPGGWTNLYGPTLVGSRYLSVWTKVAASEGASWTWPQTGNGYLVHVVTVQDCSSDTPVAYGEQNNASSASIVAPSVTPGVANTLLVGFFSVEANSTGITPAGTMTEDQDQLRGTAYRMEAAHESYAATTATGTRTATSATAGVNAGWLGAFANIVAATLRVEPFFWSL